MLVVQGAYSSLLFFIGLSVEGLPLFGLEKLLKCQLKTPQPVRATGLMVSFRGVPVEGLPCSAGCC